MKLLKFKMADKILNSLDLSDTLIRHIEFAILNFKILITNL